jgi:hypothetical protein
MMTAGMGVCVGGGVGMPHTAGGAGAGAAAEAQSLPESQAAGGAAAMGRAMGLVGVTQGAQLQQMQQLMMQAAMLAGAPR